MRTAKVLYVDETSVRQNGALLWGHVVSTPTIDILQACATKGFDAMLKMGILPGYTGVIMSDHFAMYNKLTEAIHARCNAHVLREAKGLYEIHQRAEIKAFLTFLSEMNQWIFHQKQIKEAASLEEIQTILDRYKRILTRWMAKHEIDYGANIRSRKADNPFHPEKLLVDRLLKYQAEHMRFVTDFEVAFDNNMAERAIRMTKTKMKVSGCFRSESGTENFFIIRSLIQTAKKNKQNYYEVFKKSFSQNIVLDPRT
ncbi:MAG: IS66 family transposase [Culicoidibacterales bacterium]